MKKLKKIVPLVAFLTVAVAMPLHAQNRSEANTCSNCHSSPGNTVMSYAVGTWLTSNHANALHGSNGNTYCANCHSPLQADPTATGSSNAPVLEEKWQSITCGVCHPPKKLRTEWGTPIGTYNTETAEWTPVFDDNANELCVHCHEGAKHEKDFHSYGKVMAEKKKVMCVDCHMPKVPVSIQNAQGEDEIRYVRTHNFKVAGNLPNSCITSECHANKKAEWALKEVNKGKIHGKVNSHN